MWIAEKFAYKDYLKTLRASGLHALRQDSELVCWYFFTNINSLEKATEPNHCMSIDTGIQAGSGEGLNSTEEILPREKPHALVVAATVAAAVVVAAVVAVVAAAAISRIKCGQCGHVSADCDPMRTCVQWD